MVPIQHLYGIRSLRQTVKEIKVNVDYHWFQHFNLSTSIPHFATVNYAFRDRFTPEITELIITCLLEIAINHRYVDAVVIFIDAMYFKAAVNARRKPKVLREKTAKIYTEQLCKEVNADREVHGKQNFPENNDDSYGGKQQEATNSPINALNDKGIEIFFYEVSYASADSVYKTP